MFKPKAEKIIELYKEKKSQPDFLNKKIFKGKTNIYIDWANVINWQDKLEWHVDTKRLYQFFSSFDQVNAIKLYEGHFEDNNDDKEKIKDFEKIGYTVRTKHVKEIRIPIDAKSIPLDDTTIIKRVISNALVRKLPVEAIEQINEIIRNINNGGDFNLIQHKCNFDVEMASDMRIDAFTEEDIETFVIMSGDSDFIDTVESLINEGKNVVVIGTRGRISYELSTSKAYIYDIKQIRNYVCWKREREV